MLMDGSVLLLGVSCCVAGIGRWVSDARIARLQSPAQSRTPSGYGPMFPGQKPQQWGGYPGQQQQPPYQHRPAATTARSSYPGRQPPR